MAAPKHQIIQTTHQNPHATDGLRLNVMVVSNTPDEEIKENIRKSSAKYPDWVQLQDAHDGVAVLIGGGGSIVDCVDKISELQKSGATVIAMNGSSKWARGNGIPVDWQVIVDAKEETSDLTDAAVEKHFFASQCHEKTLEKVSNLILLHFASPGIEDLFPPERIKSGGYVLLGGGDTVGIASIALAYSQGFREFHIFGYDSSHRDGKSHGYDQPQNRFMPTTEITWGGKTYEVSVAMKSQAERFLINANALKKAGCELEVYGDGLLQTIYNTKYEDLSEKEKYQLMWQLDSYRIVAPGEHLVDLFVQSFEPEGLVIDYGCGTGRAGLKLVDKGFEVMLVDFTDNCRDQEALLLPFLQCDLTDTIPIKSNYGYCTDVMEHIPTDDVDSVIDNIMESGRSVFFQISTVDDSLGEMINQPLHLTVKPHAWWKSLLIEHNYKIVWESDQGSASLFYIFNPDRREI